MNQIFDGSGDVEHLPVVGTNRRPAGSDREQLGACLGGESPQFGKSEVIAEKGAGQDAIDIDNMDLVTRVVGSVLMARSEGDDLAILVDDLTRGRDRRHGVPASAIRRWFCPTMLDPAPEAGRGSDRPRLRILIHDRLKVPAESDIPQFWRHQQAARVRGCGIQKFIHSGLAGGLVLPADVVLESLYPHEGSVQGPYHDIRRKQQSADEAALPSQALT